ncbi:MAG TPA: TetR/AcrR family transcriptional regulator [Spirochaetota bacterium]|nr:TetR/AcrR family transcriptional regulator [Spirochaetota bacterium]HNT10301.1 TetR/AcrR family transcriptional regulator [Spirochaetota bacterium]HOS39512.1 TetR/AcrR family transcriptional regulator [Spirochaetota bacterium]
MPKLVDHDEYRRELLEKCFSIFTRKGFSGVTMREIAKEIGVSTGTLYHYFPTKESIMEHMFSYVQETNVNAFTTITETLDSVPEKLDLFVEKWKEFGAFYQSMMLLAIDVLRNMSSEDSEKIFTNFSNHYTGAMARELHVSEDEARALFIYLLGIILHSLLTPRFMPYERQIDILKGMLEKMLPGDAGFSGAGPGGLVGSFLDKCTTAAPENKEPR